MAETLRLRHSFLVRVTHWLTTFSFLALLVSGSEIVVSHPRFYWGETGNVNTPALFTIPIASSRAAVPTGYGYVLPDQNGWSRYLHFQSAWVLIMTGALVIFLLVHVFMVVLAGFRSRVRAMITGRASEPLERV